MKVKIVKTGESKTYGDAYAVRLIEQRKAVPDNTKAEKADKAETPKKKAE